VDELGTDAIKVAYAVRFIHDEYHVIFSTDPDSEAEALRAQAIERAAEYKTTPIEVKYVVDPMESPQHLLQHDELIVEGPKETAAGFLTAITERLRATLGLAETPTLRPVVGESFVDSESGTQGMSGVDAKAIMDGFLNAKGIPHEFYYGTSQEDPKSDDASGKEDE
jgi:hypothetical protein